MVRISFFRTESEAGIELCDLLEREIADIGGPATDISFRVVHDATQFDFLQACLGDDVVIFDASVEDDIGSNYKAATAQPMAMDHVLVVSRTRVPLNFYGLTEGGTPETAPDAVTDRFRLSNEYLFDWLRDQIIGRLPDLPRDADETMWVNAGEVGSARDRIQVVSERIMERSLELQRSRRRSGCKVFISYLSKYSEHGNKPVTCRDEYVETLVKYVRGRKEDTSLPVRYFRPGEITSEFMTEQRRWQIVSIIDRYVRAAEEFWVFETPDYYNSWWTRAELALLAYIKAYTPEQCPKVFLYHPGSTEREQAKEAGDEFIQKLSEKHQKELARFFSNSDPGTSGYESARVMMGLRKLPKAVQWAMFKANMWMQRFLISNDTELGNIRDSMTFDDFQNSLTSHVYSESFWEDRIVMCEECMSENVGKNSFDFESFLYCHDGERISEEEFAIIVKEGRWVCGKCGTLYAVKEENWPHLVWWPVRVGKETGPAGTYVEKIPVYDVKRGNGDRP